MTNCVLENSVPPSILVQFVDILEQKPELTPDLEDIWSLFHFLSSHRPTGMALEALPPPWLYAACERLGLDFDEQERWVFLLSGMDQTLRSYVHEHQQTKSASGTA